jgi:hypothetical protein
VDILRLYTGKIGRTLVIRKSVPILSLIARRSDLFEWQCDILIKDMEWWSNGVMVKDWRLSNPNTPF